MNIILALSIGFSSGALIFAFVTFVWVSWWIDRMIPIVVEYEQKESMRKIRQSVDRKYDKAELDDLPKEKE